MRVAVTNAKAQLTELVRRAEAGEEVILTRDGQAAVRLVPVEAAVAPAERSKLLEAVRSSGAAKARTGESAGAEPRLLFWTRRFALMPDGFALMPEGLP